MTTAIQEWSRAQIRAKFVKTKGPMTVAESQSILKGSKYNLLLLGSDNREYAWEIHFRDNTFYFQDYAEYRKYVKEHPQAPFEFRKIIVDHIIDQGSRYYHFDQLALILQECPLLKELEIGVDEVWLVTLLQNKREKIIKDSFILMRPEDIDRQLNLVILPAVRELRKMPVQKVTFTDVHYDLIWTLPGVRWPNKWRVPSGPVLGGVLETIVAPEMMRRYAVRERKRKASPSAALRPTVAKKAKTTTKPAPALTQPLKKPGNTAKPTSKETPVVKDGLLYRYSDPSSPHPLGWTPTTKSPTTFPKLLALPGELRNRIYSYHLYHPTAVAPNLVTPTVRPSSLLPRSRNNLLENVRLPLHYKKLPPSIPSSQAICLVSRQLRAETKHLFYSLNRFIFHDVDALHSCMRALPRAKRARIERLTIWWHDPLAVRMPRAEGAAGVPFDRAISHLPTLKHLKSVTFNLFTDESGKLVEYQRLAVDHIRLLRKLQRRGVKIHVRCLQARRVLWEGKVRVWKGKKRDKPAREEEVVEREREARASLQMGRILTGWIRSDSLLPRREVPEDGIVRYWEGGVLVEKVLVAGEVVEAGAGDGEETESDEDDSFGEEEGEEQEAEEELEEEEEAEEEEEEEVVETKKVNPFKRRLGRC